MKYVFDVKIPDSVIPALIEAGLISSKSEFDRLVQQHGINIYPEQMILQIGKRKHLRLLFK